MATEKKKTLVIVESPAKAKTIEKYLGKEFTVRASIGHIRDLPKSNKKAIDIAAGFVPHYEVSADKKKVVDELARLAKKSERVILATDPDREGEAIAWHIAQALNLKKPERIVFHEITASAVTDAARHPRQIDEHLRKAQEARRVLDRLVGYDLSGLIWKKVRYGLSAGRVQSPALRILMEREREIRAFVPETYFVVTADTKTSSGADLLLTLSEEPRDKALIDRLLGDAKKYPWSVLSVKETGAKRSPRPPFTTSTLQQTASSRLGFSPANTMRIAQKLYEAGLITYMRTDSTNLAKEAQSAIIAEITRAYGKDQVQARVYKTRSKNAQEAHEAIRPTDPTRKNAGTTSDGERLYKLIWSRTVASQMIDAEVLRTKITANIKGSPVPCPDFVANGNRLLKEGWIAADPAARGEDVELPQTREGDTLTLVDIRSEQKETLPPQRYTEAGLVKELEKRDIGRPSTYASTIKTLQDRGYVTKEGKTLIPTDTGDIVSSFLEEHFPSYISDTFTADMEQELDDIATGKREYVKTLKDFYGPFQKDVKAKDDIAKITTLGDAPKDMLCPTCGGAMIVKLGKSGKFYSCARFPECSGARLWDGKEITGPRPTGETCPKCGKAELVEREGRYGKFIACGNYPKCKFIKQDAETAKLNSTGVKCPMCKDGEMVSRRGRFGVFYSCSNYPDCKNAIKARPTGNICPECGSLMMDGTKTIPERCSAKTCPNHHPHKLEK